MLLQFLLDIPHQQQAIAIRRLELLKETCGPLCRLLDIGGEVTITDGADFYCVGIVLKGHVPIVFEPMISKDRNVGIRRTGFITACVDWRTRVEWNPHDRRNMVHHLLEWINGGATILENSGLLCERHHTKAHHGFEIRRDPGGRWHTYRPDGTEILIHEPLLAA